MSEMHKSMVDSDYFLYQNQPSWSLLFRIFTREQFIQFVAAYVTEILAFNEVENIFADILAAIADTFDRARAE